MGRGVFSKNQRGGITAQNVNFYGNTAGRPKPRLRVLLYSIGGALGIAASIATIWQVFGPSGKEDLMFDRPQVSVTSHNQSGGITAHTVNMAPPPRHLDEAGKTRIREVLEKYPNERIRVTSVMNNAEAFGFANEILAFLKTIGRNVEGVDQVLLNQPFVGQNIGMPKNGEIDILIGQCPS